MLDSSGKQLLSDFLA